MRAGIALGSNLGDRLSYLNQGRELIVNLREVSPPLLSSRIWEAEPVGCPPGSPSFFNAVIEVGWNGEAESLLDALLAIERRLGRPAKHGFHAPRTLDLDLLYHGDETLTSERLVLPHPRISQRLFVLEPLCDIRPDLQLPGWKAPAATQLASLQEGIKQDGHSRSGSSQALRVAIEQWVRSSRSLGA